MMRLSNSALAQMPGEVEVPDYDRSTRGIGIVHLGIGAFHRAHQAVYTDDVLSRGGDWAIVGASLRNSDVRDRMVPQDGLFTVVSRDGDGDRYRVVGSVRDVVYAPGDPEALLALMAARATRIVSLTVTEKGYYREPASGHLLRDDPDIVRDLAHPAAPKTAIGFVVHALDRRRRQGQPPFTLMSCDNLPKNGRSLRQVVVDLAGHVSAGLAGWIDTNVAFPSTMVDRIVPATTESDLITTADVIGCRDDAAVVTEPFRQWVIEDSFTDGRPDWERAGAVLVSDVEPYEVMKLRLLNGAHSSIAYLGFLAGLDYVSDFMAHPDLRAFIRAMMEDEIRPTLVVPPSFDADDYIATLLDRFSNPALKHRCWQIAMDGTQKLPQRLLDTLRDRLARDLPFDRLALAIAAWVRYASGSDLSNHPIDVRDPMADKLKERFRPHLADPSALAAAALELDAVFGADLGNDQRFRRSLETGLEDLMTKGCDGAIKTAAVRK